METSKNTTTNNLAVNSSIINRIFDDDYLKSLDYVFNVIIERNDVKSAEVLLKVLTEALAARKRELAARKEIDDFYKKVIIKLRFIALPLLDDKDIIDLLGNYFTWQFGLPDYDIQEKLSGKLINTLILEDRDKLKAGLKAALLANQEVITRKVEIKTIAGWLKNYISKLGLGKADNLARTQYFIDLTKIKGMDDHYASRLKILFNFYESLKLSSSAPEGFDEAVPIMINGKLSIFRHGALEPVGKIAVKKKAVETKEVNKIGNISRQAVGVNQAKRVSADKIISNLEQLKQLAVNYPVGSFERKAVEEEIKKLEVRSKKLEVRSKKLEVRSKK